MGRTVSPFLRRAGAVLKGGRAVVEVWIPKDRRVKLRLSKSDFMRSTRGSPDGRDDSDFLHDYVEIDAVSTSAWQNICVEFDLEAKDPDPNHLAQPVHLAYKTVCSRAAVKPSTPAQRSETCSFV